jgi:hypothetical protein
MRYAHCRLVLGLVLGCLIVPMSSRGEIVYLDADFNDKTVDQQIGTGGGSVGEPMWIDNTAGGYVRSGPFPTPSLEIQDGDAAGWVNIWFKLVDDAVVESGTVVVRFSLWISEAAGTGGRVVTVRPGTGGFILAELRFNDDLSVRLADQDGVVGVIGQYEMNRAFPVALAFDMTAHTYDVWLDGQLVRDDEPVAATDENLGVVIFSAGPDDDLLGQYYIDGLFVTDDPDAVPVQPCTWGKIRTLFR